MTTKQNELLERCCSMFGKIAEEKKEYLKKYIINNAEIEFIEITDKYVFENYNDILYPKSVNLYEKYIAPPFSVLDTRNKEWLNRREKLDNYFGDSVVGRKAGLAYGNGQERNKTISGKKDYVVKGVGKKDNGTSRFDSVLCELILRWFGFPECKVYDAFAGGHIRGCMASRLGYNYTGIELCSEQVEANTQAATRLNLYPRWINDDSLNVNKYLEDNSQDLFFTCPPYGDLEKYTEDYRDLSNMSFENFLINYQKIIELGCKKLKNNRFAVFVVGDFRDEIGFYRSLVALTIQTFLNLGIRLYNELILLNSIGSAPMRASMAFRNRKMVKVHQNVLIFFKGNPQQIKNIYPTVDFPFPIPKIKQESLI
jgi:hypothetical protein